MDHPMFSVLAKATKIIQNGVMWLNSDGHLLGMNERLAQELGYSATEVKAKTIFEINPTTSLLSWKKLWRKLLEEQQLSLETEQITADEFIYPVIMRGILIQVDGEDICWCTIENLMEANRFEDLLNLTGNIGNIGSFEWDLVNNDFFVTPEIYRLLHIAPQANMDKDFFLQLIEKGLNKEDQHHLKKNLTAAIDRGEAFETEIALQIREKHENFYLNIHPIWLEEQTIKIYGVLQNLAKISKRTDDLYFTKFCMDNARDMIYWLEPDGTIAYINQTAYEKLGYGANELLGKKISFLSPDRSIDLDKYWKKLKKEGVLEFDSIYVTKTGEELSFSVIANYYNYRGKEFNCGFVRDRSGKKHRDELITMAKYSLDQSIDMIFWLNPDGTFKYFNDTFVEMTQYTRKEIAQMTVLDFFPDTTLEIFKAGWIKLQKGAVLQSVDRVLHIKGGDTIPTEMTVNLVRIGKKEYSSSIIRDVSIRKEKEKEAQNYLNRIETLQKNTEAKNLHLREEINIEYNFNNIISRDPNYKKVLRQVEQVADTDATVLILGETGTGKELLARAVHELSERDEMPMIKVNCGALPENLIESELFGHEKGAFTGAYQRKIGKFERADKGTIFLDEIGELPLDLQSKLLRVLQEGEIERIGGTEVIKIDVRVIAATNRNLEEQVGQAKFREDLYYRLNVFPIYNIPLRERREDIPALVKHFVNKYAKKIKKEITEVSQTSMNKLTTYAFLGNVRELENLVERAVILAKGKVLSFDLPSSKGQKATSAKFKTMEEIQKDHIINALKRTKGKVSGKTGAAVILDMNHKTLTSRMRKLDIKKQDYLK